MKEFVRGCLTPEIQAVAKKFLGREINTKELRLYPYIFYLTVNGQSLERSRVDEAEMNIVSTLEDEGHVLHVGGDVRFSKAFYDYVNEIQWLGYVEHKFTEEAQQAMKSLKQ